MHLFRPGGLDLTKKSAQTIQLGKEDKVLDVGCGLGASLEFLSKTYEIHAYGADISTKTIEKAKDRLPTADFCVVDGCHMKCYSDSLFDAVFMECSLTLMKEPLSALREANRVLKTGGHIVINGPYVKNSECKELCNNGRLSRQTLLNRLKDLGFSVVLDEDETPLLIQFYADVIFEYGSMKEYSCIAQSELGGKRLGCEIPLKDTGYLQIIARKDNC